MPLSTDFLLVPDKSAARRLRRDIASKNAMLGVQVGTWIELIELLKKTYLLSAPGDNWNERLREGGRSISDAFWAESLKVAEPETLSSIANTLRMLLLGAGPIGRLISDNQKVLPERPSRHLADLCRLHQEMDYVLPDDLAVIRSILDTEPKQMVRGVFVYYIDGMPVLSSWQRALVEKVNKDSGAMPDSGLTTVHASSLECQPPENASSALSQLKNGLFEAETDKIPLDSSVQVLAARDYLEEVEVAAGMIQKILNSNPSVKPADIAVLLPSDSRYSETVSDLFDLAGLPLSGLSIDKPVRDIGRETVLYFLLSINKPAPAMSLAAFLSSPLLSWSQEEGNCLAQIVMDGNFKLEPLETLSSEGRKVLELVKSGVEKPKELSSSLRRLSTLMNDKEVFASHVERARALIGELLGVLQNAKEDFWKDIIRRASPESLSERVESELTREGIAVFYEDEEAWRDVRHLFVLGFGSGHYPFRFKVSPVFSEEDLILLKDKIGYGIETAMEPTDSRRKQFRRQIGSARESLTILLPRMDTVGGELVPSSTLTFMARLYNDIDEPEELVLDLDSESDRRKIKKLATIPEAEPVSPRIPEIKDLSLNLDLLTLRKDEDGFPKPESPSGLEKLMISPFAWLLMRLGVEPTGWEPENLDVTTKGTLAHEVFENLFLPDRPLPSREEIIKKVPDLLREAILKMMPFILMDEWRVERKHLAKEIETAALSWAEMLVQMDATILKPEVELYGTLDELPIRGSSDLVLSLPKGRLYVVDYKKSSSKGRRERMAKGYDSQASLYRLMLQSGGPKDKELAVKFKDAQEIGVIYYMMNDQTALVDIARFGKEIRGIEEVGDKISVNALTMLRQRITDVKDGKVILNRDGDDEWFEKEAGINASYSLDASPLVRMFMHKEEVTE